MSICAYREGPDICIRVTDSGEGIAPSALPFVFEPFLQADSSTTRRHGGLGLGLAIVRQLVSAHGGSVRAESEGPGKGATFIVQLPARSTVPLAPKTTGRFARVGKGAASDAPHKPPRLEGLRLLVVDDEEDARTVVAEMLRQQGADVDVAASAEEALEHFERERPDVLVSDVAMPVTDGYAFIRRIRELPAGRGGHTPAIALTGYARAEDAERAFAAGFQKHIPKPVDPAQLASIVANLGGRSLS